MNYTNLVNIGLRDYLNTYFFYKEWYRETYLERLDTFVACKSDEQKNILIKKFEHLTDHVIINDHLYELMIGAVFHPNGAFQNVTLGSSPDIIDQGVNIEIKNINSEPEEIERVKIMIPNTVSYGPFPSDSDFENRLRKKFLLRVDQGKKQIQNKGIIYIIWDTSLKGSTERIPKIEKLFRNLCVEEKKLSPDVTIVTFDFEKLRRLVSNT